jgi:hypothetical protein
VGTSAVFGQLAGIAFDYCASQLFIADFTFNRIRMLHLSTYEVL